MTQSMSAREFRQNMAEAIEQAARGDEIVITKHGREQVAVVSIDAYRALLAYEDAEDARLAAAALADPRPSVPMADVLAETVARTQ